jgi:collagenase-like PrtC family protease
MEGEAEQRAEEQGIERVREEIAVDGADAVCVGEGSVNLRHGRTPRRLLYNIK